MKEEVSTLEEFKNRWKYKCEEIKKSSFTNNQCLSVYQGFMRETLTLMMYYRPDKIPINFLEEISNDLDLSLEISKSNYRKENKGFWSKIFNFKNINIGK